MPQNVPSFEFSDRAKQVRAFVFEFWCANGRGPTLREAHEATDLDRRQIIQAYKELQLGIVITVDENTQNCNLLKAPPFSSYPSQVRAYIDDEFHSFVGCASEAVAFSHMPLGTAASIGFFALLLVAAIGSAISFLELATAQVGMAFENELLRRQIQQKD